jgi:hypothetical protein
MHVEDSSGAYEIEDAATLEALLTTRNDRDANEFWMYASEETYPMLGIFVRGDLAEVHYLQGEDHAGFRSLGGTGLDPNGKTIFYMGTEEQEAPNRFVVAFRDAVRAAKEFMTTGRRPGSLDWLELR